MKYYQFNSEISVVLSSEPNPDPFLVRQIDERFLNTDTDALILGQGPVLSLGFIDPRNHQCDCPSPYAFAIRKKCFKEIGDVDAHLSSALAADYVLRLKQNGKKCQLAIDIRMPITEKFPLDVTNLWMDGLLLDFKHGTFSVRKAVLKRLVQALIHYDATIGNYSRKRIIMHLPSFVGKLFRYGLKKGTVPDSLDFLKHYTSRGCYRMEVRTPSRYPLVSIIIRTYKKTESLRKTLESVRWLDYPNYEVVIVEDGFPESESMVKNDYRDLPIRYYNTGSNKGRAAAANYGFEKSKGEWINLLDDDDYLFPEHLTVGISEAETTGSSIVFLQSLALETSTISETPCVFSIEKIHHMCFPRVDPFTMCGFCMTPDNGVLFKKELLSDGTMMREDLGANEDWELWLQLMTKAVWTTVHYATCAFANPASQEEKKQRDERYREWKGLQFESPQLVYSTSAQQLARYFVGIMDDVDALETSGELNEYIKQIREYYSYSREELRDAFADLEKHLRFAKGGEFTAKQFNRWFCAVYEHIGGFSESARKEEILRLKQWEIPAYPLKRIQFSGFWPWFEKDDNFFLDSLEKKYRVEQVSDPDYLITSIFGKGFYEYILFPCVRIFFSGENYAPDFNLVDYATSYNLMEYPERYRYIPEFYVDIRRLLHRLNQRPTFEEALEMIRNKKEFCNFIYGDSKCCVERAAIFKTINAKKRVLSAGSWLNNTENGFRAKMLSTKDEVQRRCRFTIAVESYPISGFITEKLTDAFLMNTIPIYYGDPNVSELFNPKAFIDVRKFESLDDLADEVVRLDNCPEEMAKMMAEPVFKNQDYLKKLNHEFESFYYSIFDQNPQEAIRRPVNGQPEVHQKYIALLQKHLFSPAYRKKEARERKQLNKQPTKKNRAFSQ